MLKINNAAAVIRHFECELILGGSDLTRARALINTSSPFHLAASWLERLGKIYEKRVIAVECQSVGLVLQSSKYSSMCDSRENISLLHSRSIELDCSRSCRVKRRLNQKYESIEIQTIAENGLPQAFRWSVHGATVPYAAGAGDGAELFRIPDGIHFASVARIRHSFFSLLHICCRLFGGRFHFNELIQRVTPILWSL